MGTSLKESEAVRLKLDSARLVHKAAEYALEEAEHGSEQLKQQITHGDHEVRDLSMLPICSRLLSPALASF